MDWNIGDATPRLRIHGRDYNLDAEFIWDPQTGARLPW